ncbi:FAD dependent oxidoreductase [Xylogone sp. PMI_703]|nr:FAD dependent oxidoreductase [Xylogone sp. PMI_703]
MPPPTKPPKSIIIIGAGVFGLSTALALSRRPAYSSAKITLLEASPSHPNPTGSSVDTSRIIRADYPQLAYARLALEAQEAWRNRSENGWGGQGRYTESGFALVADRGSAGYEYVRKTMENIRQVLGEDGDAELRRAVGGKIEVLEGAEEVRRVTGGALGGDWGYVNWGSGWADAEGGVRYAMEKLDKERVEVRIGAEVESLVYGNESEGKGKDMGAMAAAVTGVKLAGGQQLPADLVVLATGAWTGKLVDLRGRAVATGQVLTYMDITEQEQDILSRRPVVMSHTSGIYVIPPRNRVLKIARHGFGYRNPVAVQDPSPGAPAGEIEVSVPRVGISVPAEGYEACHKILESVLPGLEKRQFSRSRVCWYTDTQLADFLIDYHPQYSGLFLATGGSGHGYKFLPVIGEKIVDAMEGTLVDELREIWQYPKDAVRTFAWEESLDGSRGAGTPGMVLERELKRGVV